MAEQKLLVKREGDFHYPIYLKNDFQDLALSLIHIQMCIRDRYNVDITGDLQNILGGSAPSVRAGY